MKLNFVLIFLLTVNTLITAQTLSGVAKSQDILLLKQQDWFIENYNNYLLDTATLKQINYEDIKNIQVVMGTWCSDSKTQVPRFFKILDYTKYQSKINVILVDKNKKAKVKKYKSLGIVYVPTFIFYNKHNKEISRIVETPKETLEKDLLKAIM